jgi:aspartyl protease family protein
VTYPFDPTENVIIVTTRIAGPGGSMTVDLALDTGATSTLIALNALKVAGYTSAHETGKVEMLTGSGIEVVPKVKLIQIDALGKRRRNLQVIAHTLPKGARVDGLLGLDFFRKTKLTIDFRKYIVKVD